jgi:transcriptional regulator
MLILRTLARGPSHGWGIAQLIQKLSDEVLRVEEGSLYPALHRLELGGDLAAEWGVSENNRRARIYKLTAGARASMPGSSAGRCRWAPSRACWDGPRALPALRGSAALPAAGSTASWTMSSASTSR